MGDKARDCDGRFISKERVETVVLSDPNWMDDNDISTLNQPPRRERSLRAAGISTVSGLLRLSLEDLREIKGVTWYGIQELKRAVRFHREFYGG